MRGDARVDVVTGGIQERLAEVDDQCEMCLESEAAERALRAVETRPDLLASIDRYEQLDEIHRDPVRTSTTALTEALEVNRKLAKELGGARPTGC